MPTNVLALRGATTFAVDESAHVAERVVELVGEMLARNGVEHDDVISILFTATDDLSCTFPATTSAWHSADLVKLVEWC